MNHIKLDNYSINYQVFFKKIKHMYIRYEDNTIKITCNKKISQQTIESFMFKHKKWILKYHSIEKYDLYNESNMYIWGKKYSVVVDENIQEYIYFDHQYIRIQDTLFNTKKIEKFYKSMVLKEIQYILDLDKYFIKQYILLDNVTYKSQLMKSRLGSCIGNKRIVKLNSLLARLDKKYMKLVLFHELSHLKVSNHSKSFHTLLETIFPDHKYLNKSLKKEIKRFVY
ncbi:MAG: DUF45 domain-containing protein [Tenericutes bacterium]|jgi:predicted metal-dependent hydrolase|nr:DUF45 domain-containing protein [Mycoplasmatota bacterium]